MLHVHNKPCSGCPYRRDCPSGVWAPEEYDKLAQYDADTHAQPPGVFLCHDGDRTETMCRGWLDTHDKPELLSLRKAVAARQADVSVFDLAKSDVACFASGQEARDHGMADIDHPSDDAEAMQLKLTRRHPGLKTLDDI